jgi:hypothetical protein
LSKSSSSYRFILAFPFLFRGNADKLAAVSLIVVEQILGSLLGAPKINTALPEARACQSLGAALDLCCVAQHCVHGAFI